MPTREEHAATAEIVVQSFVPKFKRVAKKDSTLMQLLATFLGWLGMKTFMEDFSTTLGFTAYLTDDHMNNISVIFHEGRHAQQGNKYTRPLQGALYLLPQLIAIIALFACLTLVGFSLGGFTWCWWPIALLLLLAAPLPAYWRMKFEFDAYCVSMAIRHWTRGDVADSYIDNLVSNFTSGAYYFMWPFKSYLRKRFLRKLEWIKASKVGSDPYYVAVHEFLETRGLLARKLPLTVST